MVLILTEWLRFFDGAARFQLGSLGTPDQVHNREYHTPSSSNFQGYFAAVADDGKPFLILFANSGHVNNLLPYGMSFSPHTPEGAAPASSACVVAAEHRPRHPTISQDQLRNH